MVVGGLLLCGNLLHSHPANPTGLHAQTPLVDSGIFIVSTKWIFPTSAPNPIARKTADHILAIYGQ